MVIDLISKIRAVQLLKPTTMSDVDAKTTGEFDIGTSKQGIWIINLAKGTTGVTNLAIYTSATGTFTPGSTNICTITQDTLNSTEEDTVTTNEIVAIDADGIYIFQVENLKRYVEVVYDGDDADSIISMCLVCDALVEAPYAAARTAY